MRYYKPDKEELVKGFICEMYDDDSNTWQEITIDSPKRYFDVLEEEDIRVAYLTPFDFHQYKLDIVFLNLGGIEVITGYDQDDNPITEMVDTFSDTEADILKGGVQIGTLILFPETPEDPNIITPTGKYKVKNKYELSLIIDKLA